METHNGKNSQKKCTNFQHSNRYTFKAAVFAESFNGKILDILKDQI